MNAKTNFLSQGIMEGYGIRLQDNEFALLMRKHDVEDRGRWVFACFPLLVFFKFYYFFP